MSDPADEEDHAGKDRPRTARRYYKREFWSDENRKFTIAGFRQEKSARIVNRLATGKECDLLDVGCGPASVARFTDANVHYYGIDIAIHEPAPNLIEMDILKSPIRFGNKKFDIVLAQGVFEYMGDFQTQKLAEIAALLKDDGKFVVSYVNFGHRKREIYWPYNNIQTIGDFERSLARVFRVEKRFPTSHNWSHSEPNRRFLKFSQKHLTLNIPLISPMLAVEYFFICSASGPADAAGAS